MRKLYTIFMLLALLCNLTLFAQKHQRMPMPEATEEWDMLARKEFRKQRDAFLANDSSARTLSDLGWAGNLKSDLLFHEDGKHAFSMPFGIIFHKAAFGSSVEFSPCGESEDTDAYWSQHAVAVHKNLDSALVIVKRKAVARLFMRAAHTIWGKTESGVADSTRYDNLYSACMHNAEFDCIAVNKDREGRYIVYATLYVPRIENNIVITNEDM